MASLMVRDLYLHPDVVRVPVRAVGAWALLGTMCAAAKDPAGLVTAEMIEHVGATPRDIATLVAHGLLDEEHGDYWLSHGRTGVRRIWQIDLERPKREWIPDSVRLAVYSRDGFACVTCGATEDLTLDHIYPWSLGGTDTEDNLQTLCRPCNSRKGAKL